MQAYNFYDNTLNPSAVGVDYTAYWSNTSVPDLANSLALLSLGLGVLGFARRRTA